MSENPTGTNNDGFFTRDGWYFLGDQHNFETSQAMGHYEFEASHAQQWIETAASISALCRLNQTPCVFVIAPAKWSVYRDKLEGEDGFIPGRETILDRLAALAPEHNVDLLDLRAPLIAARETADTYSPRDSHWSGFGAFVGWKAIASHLQKHFPSELFYDPGEPIEIKTENKWDEASHITADKGENQWTFPVFSDPFPDFEMAYHNGAWSVQGGGRLVHRGELPISSRTKNAPTRLNAFILRDSMGDIMSPYFHSSFAYTYQRSHGINGAGDVPSMTAILQRHAPDLVIFMITERYLTLPLYDLNAAASCVAFEQHQGAIQQWPTFVREKRLPVDGWFNPKQGVCVTLPDGSSKRHVKISMFADAPGTLAASYSTPAGGSRRSFNYPVGASDHFLTISEKVQSNHLWVKDQKDGPGIFLREVAVAY